VLYRLGWPVAVVSGGRRAVAERLAARNGDAEPGRVEIRAMAAEQPRPELKEAAVDTP
jgi:phosphoglycolate phosphatase-like HAD superfamily hydrolase